MTNLSEQLGRQILGRRILITGDASGLSGEIALQLATFGGDVLIADSDQNNLNDTLNTWWCLGGKGDLNGVVADISTNGGIIRLFNKVNELFGSQLDVLINNGTSAYTMVANGLQNQCNRDIDTSLLAYIDIACTRMALNSMILADHPHIFNIGCMQLASRKETVIKRFAENLHKKIDELGIRVTNIEPNAINNATDQPALRNFKAADNGCWSRSDDVASAIVYALNQHESCNVAEIHLAQRLGAI